MSATTFSIASAKPAGICRYVFNLKARRPAGRNPPDPKAEYYEDSVTIVMPMQVLGVFRDYRFSLAIGQYLPGAIDEPAGI